MWLKQKMILWKSYFYYRARGDTMLNCIDYFANFHFHWFYFANFHILLSGQRWHHVKLHWLFCKLSFSLILFCKLSWEKKKSLLARHRRILTFLSVFRLKMIRCCHCNTVRAKGDFTIQPAVKSPLARFALQSSHLIVFRLKNDVYGSSIGESGQRWLFVYY
jgi:hypothetical protein